MRARVVKPQLFKNEDLARLPDAATILFIGLWCMADKDGRLEDRPLKIKVEVRPYSDCDCDGLLSLLHDAGLIVRYEVKGVRCIQIVSWSRHGRPHPNEPTSELPEMTEDALKSCKKISLHDELRSSLSSSLSSFSSSCSSNTAADKPPPLSQADAAGSPPDAQSDSAPKRPAKTRKRDELFDAVAEITGSDVHTSARHIGSVCSALRKADPPYTAEEVIHFAAIAPVELPWLTGRLTLGTVEKYIGIVRAKPLPQKGATGAGSGTSRSREQSKRYDQARDG